MTSNHKKQKTASGQIPAAVVEADHKFEAANERTTEELARHRWHHTLDPDGPGYSLTAYANAVERSFSVIHKYANGYAEWAISRGRSSTLNECISLATYSAERQEIAQAVAEAEGTSPSTVVKRRGEASFANTVEQAKERAERTGVPVAEAARDIATKRKAHIESDRRHRAEQKQRHTARYMALEGKIARSKRLLTEALNEADGVAFSEEETELLQESVANLRAVLDLFDLRVGGDPDVDWDSELAAIAGDPS